MGRKEGGKKAVNDREGDHADDKTRVQAAKTENDERKDEIELRFQPERSERAVDFSPSTFG